MAGASAETGVPEAAVRALVAGADLLCLGSETGPALFEQTLNAIADAVDEGRLPLERLADAAARTAALSTRFPLRAPRKSKRQPSGATLGFKPASRSLPA